MRPARPVLFCYALALPVLAAGCGAKSAEVAGRVTFAGRAVTGGSVVLYCPDGQIVRGLVGPDGRYAIPNVPHGAAVATVQTHARIPDGMKLKQLLPPAVNGPTTLPADRVPEQVVAVPPRYAVPEESGLAVVVDRPQVEFDIALER